MCMEVCMVYSMVHHYNSQTYLINIYSYHTLQYSIYIYIQHYSVVWKWLFV